MIWSFQEPHHFARVKALNDTDCSSPIIVPLITKHVARNGWKKTWPFMAFRTGAVIGKLEEPTRKVIRPAIMFV